jgi:outer membrane protein assembly factor BamB
MQDPLLGAWWGQARSSGESKLMGLRFELDKSGSIIAFFDMPDLKFHNLGPIHLKRQGTEYTGPVFNLRLAPDKNHLTGVWSFDGNDVTFELKRSAVRNEPTPSTMAGRVAQPLWTFKTGNAIWSSPAIAENIVYFSSSDGIIYALRDRTGKLFWQFKTGGRVMGHPTVDGSYLYALSDDGYLYKLERHTGQLIWRFDTHGGAVARELPTLNSTTYDYLTSAATVMSGSVYIGSADRKLYAVDAQTGQERWHFDTQGIVRSTPAVSGGQVFIGSYDHNVYAVDATTGAPRWKYDTLREVVSSPLVVNGTVYVGSRCSNLFALDARTGKVKWKYFYWSSWVESSARLRDGILYVGSSDYQQLFAIDAASGKLLWNFSTDGSAWSTPAVTDRHVYIGAVGVVGYFIEHQGGFFAVDRVTGKLAWRYQMAVIPDSFTYGVASSPAVDRELVFFGGLDGTFYAFKDEG